MREGLDGVFETNGNRVHLQRTGRQFNRPVERKASGKRTERPTWRQTGFIGHHTGQVDIHVGNIVPVNEVHRPQKGHGKTNVNSGPGIAAVGQNPIPQAENGAVLLDGQFQLMNLIPPLAHVHQTFLTILDPFHRTAEFHGQMTGHEFFPIERGLGPKRAAHVFGHNHPHLTMRQLEVFGQQVTFDMRALRGQPQGQPLTWAIHCQATPGLHGLTAGAVAAKALFNNQVGLGKGRIGITGRNMLMVEHIVAPVGIEARRVSPEGVFGVKHDIERIILDIDQLKRVFEGVFIAGHHNGQRVADVFDLINRQRPKDRPVGLAGQVRRAHIRQHRPQVFDICAGEHGPHAGQGRRLSGVYGRDFCVGVDAAHKAHDDHARQNDIGQVLPVPN